MMYDVAPPAFSGVSAEGLGESRSPVVATERPVAMSAGAPEAARVTKDLGASKAAKPTRRKPKRTQAQILDSIERYIERIEDRVGQLERVARLTNPHAFKDDP